MEVGSADRNGRQQSRQLSLQAPSHLSLSTYVSISSSCASSNVARRSASREWSIYRLRDRLRAFTDNNSRESTSCTEFWYSESKRCASFRPTWHYYTHH